MSQLTRRQALAVALTAPLAPALPDAIGPFRRGGPTVEIMCGTRVPVAIPEGLRRAHARFVAMQIEQHSVKTMELHFGFPFGAAEPARGTGETSAEPQVQNRYGKTDTSAEVSGNVRKYAI